MKAVNIHGPNAFSLDDVAYPTIGDDDALVQVMACGVCGSDLAYIDRGAAGFTRKSDGPSALGHEACGQIIALGANIAGFGVGDRVAINPIDWESHTAIGNGAPEGAFAEVVSVRNVRAPGRLLRLPDTLDYDVAALTEPMGVALHTVNRSGAKPDSKVVVLGVGPIGLGVVIWLKHRGVRHVVAVDLSPKRLERARSLGADAAVRAGAEDLAEQLTSLHGATRAGGPDTDIFIDAAGAPAALAELIGMAKFAAGLTVVAVYKKPVEIDLSAMLHKEMILTTSMGYPSELAEVVDFLGRNAAKMRGYISDRYALSDIHAAVARAREPTSAKVMVYMEH